VLFFEMSVSSMSVTTTEAAGEDSSAHGGQVEHRRALHDAIGRVAVGIGVNAATVTDVIA